MTDVHADPQCDVAHGRAPAAPQTRTLIAVFASPVARYLLRYGTDVGFRPVLLEPDTERAAAGGFAGVTLAASAAEYADASADVVVTDHHRSELGPVLRDFLATPAAWIGLMGSPRHPAPHIPLLTGLGVSEADIARVHRPIGLNIGSKSPPEIAIATIAGLIAEHNSCPGGFSFSSHA
ncbi:MAG TPA: XdhC family protein [Streptosporangiaceae bacterium]|nr:XdhC family protein [Streptosporangiaceae bacterium]